jgi:hypothetical protein
VTIGKTNVNPGRRTTMSPGRRPKYFETIGQRIAIRSRTRPAARSRVRTGDPTPRLFIDLESFVALRTVSLRMSAGSNR